LNLGEPNVVALHGITSGDVVVARFGVEAKGRSSVTTEIHEHRAARHLRLLLKTAFGRQDRKGAEEWRSGGTHGRQNRRQTHGQEKKCKHGSAYRASRDLAESGKR
jgi:hypothetical protein